MILVDERTRERVEEVVAELLRTGDYDKVFRCFASQMMMNSTRDGRRQTLYEPDGHGLRLLAASRIALARIIHQPQKSTRERAFDVRITLRATASQEHLAPQTSPSGCPDSAQMGRTVAIGHTSASQPAWAYNERVALEPLTLSMELKGSARSAARTPTRLNCASIPAPPGTTRVTKS